MTEQKYDCQKCGVCCSYFHNIPILDNEVNNIDENLKKYTKISPIQHNGLSMKFVTNTTRCIALDGEIGKNVICSIYEIRPPVCRRFEAGSDLCKKIRLEVLGIT